MARGAFEILSASQSLHVTLRRRCYMRVELTAWLPTVKHSLDCFRRCDGAVRRVDLAQIPVSQTIFFPALLDKMIASQYSILLVVPKVISNRSFCTGYAAFRLRWNYRKSIIRMAIGDVSVAHGTASLWASAFLTLRSQPRRCRSRPSSPLDCD